MTSRYVTVELTEQQAQALRYVAGEGMALAESQFSMDEREVGVAQRALDALDEAIHGVEPANARGDDE